MIGMAVGNGDRVDARMAIGRSAKDCIDVARVGRPGVDADRMPIAIVEKPGVRPVEGERGGVGCEDARCVRHHAPSISGGIT